MWIGEGRGRALVAGWILAGLAGCISGGRIDGRAVEPGGKSEPVTASYRSDATGGGGKIWIAIPGDEKYTGRYLPIGPKTDPETVRRDGGGWWSGAAYGGEWSWGAGGPWEPPTDYDTYVTTYRGKVLAQLEGSRGDTMRCVFDLADAGMGMVGGGSGECRGSDGVRIDAKF